MPLINLLQRCSKFGGDSLADAGSKASLLTDVNAAAKRIWDDYDLIGSIREETISCDISEGMQALPWYMSAVRGAKIHGTRVKIDLLDEHQYYQTNAFFQSPYTVRVKSEVPLFTPLATASKITISIPLAENSKFEVTVRGSGQAGASVSETMIFNPGELSKTTKTLFIPSSNGSLDATISAVTKNILTVNDVLISDMNSNILGFIPARSYTAAYLRLQIYDQMRFVIDPGYDIMFKLRFQYLLNDSDTFLNDLYDDAIYWRFVHDRTSLKNSDPEALAYAQAALTRSFEIVKSIAINNQASIESRLDFGRNRFLNLTRNPFNAIRGFGPYNDIFGYGYR